MELNQEQKDLLTHLYHGLKLYFGRDKLFQYVYKNHPEAKISRRMVQKFLDGEPVYQKTKPPPPKVRISAIAIDKPGYFCIDLSGNLPRDKNYNYYLGFIEVSTRKLFTRPLKTKNATEVRDALKDIIDKNELKVTLCRSDNGTEFHAEFSEFLKERDIKQIYSDVASPWQNVIERYNRTIKAALFKNELATGKKDWVDALEIITENINNTWNRSLKTTADEAEHLPDGVRIDRLKNYGNMKKHKHIKTVLKVGDLVRLRIRYPGNYAKKKQTYSNILYIITKVVVGSEDRMVTYKISEDGVNDRKGIYSILDLLKVKDRVFGDRFLDIQQEQDEDFVLVDENAVGSRSIRDQLEVDQLLENTESVPKTRETRRPKPIEDNIYVIESILKRKKFGKKFKYLVKYEGYPISEATWEYAKDIDAKDLMDKFMETIKKKKK